MAARPVRWLWKPGRTGRARAKAFLSAQISARGIDRDAPVTARTMVLAAKEPRLRRRPILDTVGVVVVGFDRARYEARFGRAAGRAASGGKGG